MVYYQQNMKGITFFDIILRIRAGPSSLAFPLATNNNDGWGVKYNIINYVDDWDNRTDYHCGHVTYTGHTGTDFLIWPYSWIQMDNNEVSIVAGKFSIEVFFAQILKHKFSC